MADSDLQKPDLVSHVTSSGHAARNTILPAGPVEDVDGVHQAIQPDGIAKFLFTSGSTSMPKGVITTHRMLCANQQMLLQTFPCFGGEPPIFLDCTPL